MAPTPSIRHIASARASQLYLVHGEDDGQPAWYYVEVDKMKLPIFLRLCEKKTARLPLPNYGKVVAYGWGTEPPDEVKARVQREYGIEAV